MKTLDQIGQAAVKAKTQLANLLSSQKEAALKAVADKLVAEQDFIIKENQHDISQAEINGLSAVMIERLTLNQERIEAMAEGVRQVALLPDPIGEVSQMSQRPNGLMIGRMSVPMGAVGIIYESRPNVTADAFSICFKTGNATVLRGGKEAIHSNIAIVKTIQQALESVGLDANCIQILEDTSRETATKMMRLNKYLDVLIPRGGAGLIQSVMQNSTVPVIETGVGNCHVYIHQGADLQKAVDIVINAKTQRPSVCNAAESLLIDESIYKEVLPKLSKELLSREVELVGDAQVCALVPEASPADENDWGTEYLSLKLSVKIVADITEAINHISKYGTGHSEAIVTEDYSSVQKFIREVDAAAVYANASTRFTDGFEFGYGAEIGISTQKLHARGPMGINELTSYKYIIYGEGQVK